jgi:hypothetical protein
MTPTKFELFNALPVLKIPTIFRNKLHLETFAMSCLGSQVYRGQKDERQMIHWTEELSRANRTPTLPYGNV